MNHLVRAARPLALTGCAAAPTALLYAPTAATLSAWRRTGPSEARFEDLLVDTATLLAFGSCLWLTGCSLLMLLGALLGPGSALESFAANLTPRFWRRLAVTTVSAAVLGGPLVAGSAHAADSQLPPETPHVGGLPLPDRPSDRLTPAPRLERRIGPAPNDRPQRPGARRHEVTVRPGDSLWRLASAELGAGSPDHEIADEVVRWYVLNRDVIGADPDLVLPGTVLQVPR